MAALKERSIELVSTLYYSKVKVFGAGFDKQRALSRGWVILYLDTYG